MRYPTPENEVERNEALRSYRIMDTPPETKFDEIGKLAAQICGCSVSYVSFIEDDRFWFKSKYGLPEDFEGCPREIAFCSVTVCGSELVLSEDLSLDERFRNFEFVVNEPHFRFYAAMPLMTPDGFAIGTICVMDTVPRELTTEQLEALRRLAQQTIAQLEHRRRIIELDQAMRELDDAHAALVKEKSRADNLLSAILPTPIAQELMQNEKVAPRYFPEATVIFADVVGFTKVAEKTEPVMLLGMLDAYFAHFDDACAENGSEKLKTIGDAYMAVAGVPELDRLHVLRACLSALSMQSRAEKVSAERDKLRLPNLTFRIGIHTGAVIAGIVGRRRFTYDVWGDTVNMAAFMETHSQPGRVNVSEQVYLRMQPYFDFTGRGAIEVKNKTLLAMYFLDRLKPEFSADTDGRIANEKLFAMVDPAGER